MDMCRFMIISMLNLAFRLLEIPFLEDKLVAEDDEGLLGWNWMEKILACLPMKFLGSQLHILARRENKKGNDETDTIISTQIT